MRKLKWRFFKKELAATQKKLYNILLIIKLNYDIKKAKETNKSIFNTVGAILGFINRHTGHKMIKRKTKLIVLFKLMKVLRVCFSQDFIDNDVTELVLGVGLLVRR